MDDNRDKEMARNQLIAIVLMSLLVVAWFQWFKPQQPQPPKKSPAPAATQPLQEAERGEQATPEGEPSAEGTSLLPPIPEVTDATEEEVTLEDGDLRLVFTRIGGRLKRAFLILGENGDQTIQLVPESVLPDTETVYPFGLRFEVDTIRDGLNWRRFEVERDPAGKAVTFSLKIDGRAEIRKRFSLTDKRHVFQAEVEYRNLSDAAEVVGMDDTPAYVFTWGPDIASGPKTRYTKESMVWHAGGKVEIVNTSSMKPSREGVPYQETVRGVDWMAVRSGYFVAAMRPEREGEETEGPLGWVEGTAERFGMGFAIPRFEVAGGQVQANVFSVYVGPAEHRALAEGWETLPEVQRFFTPTWEFMDWFAKLLLRMLNWFHDSIFPNYGWAIIFLTIVVRMGMYPLTLKSMRSMKRMQLLGPEMEQLKAKYGEDPQELNKRMMELYKERGVNPLGGCLPIMLQMPVFIALYRMLSSAFELRGAPFLLWVSDLSQPDQLFHMPWMASVPFLGETFQYFNLLPILMGAAMVLNSKLTPSPGAQNPQQKMMMTIMPVFFSFICYNMASGLNLYILTSTVLGMVQQKFTGAGNVKVEPKKKTPRKKAHFYTAAQARKREWAKEQKLQKQEKRRKSSRPDGGKGKR